MDRRQTIGFINEALQRYRHCTTNEQRQRIKSLIREAAERYRRSRAALAPVINESADYLPEK
jgi:hypothetical protein